jgi:hypothetical protein
MSAQTIIIKFNVLPYRDDFPGQSEVTIERFSMSHTTTEEMVEAANKLGATSIAILSGDQGKA